jgi:hypothetical protein
MQREPGSVRDLRRAPPFSWFGASSRLFYGALTFACLALTTCKTAGFKEVFTSLDSQGSRRREHFFADTEEIHCIGKMVSGVADITVSGTLRATQLWDSRTESFKDVDRVVDVKELAPGASKNIIVDFLVKRENGAPYVPGKYTCELAIDGELEGSASFDVAFPACPLAPIVSGALCEGFVAPRSSCPGAQSEPCECGDAGVWQCE